MKKKKMVIFSIIFILVACIGTFLFLKWNGPDEGGKETKQTEKEKQKKGEKETDELKTGGSLPLEGTVDEKIETFLINNNQGLPVASFSLDKKHSLSITKTGVNEYDDEFVGDKVVWIEKGKDAYTYKELTDGSKLVKVIQTEKGPFLTIGDEVIVVLYEHVKYNDYAYNESGVVYKVTDKGELVSLFEIKDAFEDITVTKNTLTIVQKVYTDNYNQFPRMFKPYKLETYVYKKGEWKLTNTKSVEANLTGQYEK